MPLRPIDREPWPHFFHHVASVYDPRPDSPLAMLRYPVPSREERGRIDVAGLGVLSDGTLLAVVSYERTDEDPSMAGSYTLNTVHEERGKPSPPPPLPMLLEDLDLVGAVVHEPEGRRDLFIELRNRPE